MTLFATWLKGRDYADQSIRSTLEQVHFLARMQLDGVAPERLAQPRRRTFILRILAAAESGDDVADIAPELVPYAQQVLTALDAQRNTHGLRGGRRKRGKRPAPSVPDATWPLLLEELAAPSDEPERAVLFVQATTGLRIGDILRIERKALVASSSSGLVRLTAKGGRERVLRTDGAPDAWARLAALAAAAPDAQNVAQLVSVSADVSSGGAGYKACARALHGLEKQLGIDRLHTHRLRRTVAVQALRVTGDVFAVQELIGQEPGSKAIATYVDEARSDRVAELGGQVRARFGKRK